MAKPTATAPRADIYETVTATIVSALERAASPTEWPWVKAAGNGVPVNARTRKPYNGINRLLLGIAGMGARPGIGRRSISGKTSAPRSRKAPRERSSPFGATFTYTRRPASE